MSAKQISSGNSMPYKNAGETDINWNDVVDLGGGIGIASSDIAAGESGNLDVKGVFELPKNTGEAMTQSQEVFWDGTEVVGTAAAYTRAGRVWEVAGSSAAVVEVLIDWD